VKLYLFAVAPSLDEHAPEMFAFLTSKKEKEYLYEENVMMENKKFQKSLEENKLVTAYLVINDSINPFPRKRSPYNRKFLSKSNKPINNVQKMKNNVNSGRIVKENNDPDLIFIPRKFSDSNTTQFNQSEPVNEIKNDMDLENVEKN